MPRAARAIRIFENSLLAIQYKGLRIMEAMSVFVFLLVAVLALVQMRVGDQR